MNTEELASLALDISKAQTICHALLELVEVKIDGMEGEASKETVKTFYGISYMLENVSMTLDKIYSDLDKYL